MQNSSQKIAFFQKLFFLFFKHLVFKRKKFDYFETFLFFLHLYI